MKTNTKLLEVTLSILSKNKESKISLEEALAKAVDQTGLYLKESYDDIRYFLRNKELISHNPRLTLLNQHQKSVENIYFVSNEIHKDFIADTVTDKCLGLIHNEKLLWFLQV